MYYYVDVHSHTHEYDVVDIAEFLTYRKLKIVAVSDDYKSSIKTLKIASLYKDLVYPCVGLHPWEVKGRESINVARLIVELALENDIKCFGEVGLDTKFVGETIDVQREVFRIFLEAARDNSLFLNLHTAGTWEEVFNLLVKYDIGAANFHWYTGPLHLLRQIADEGYTISVNPAVKIQAKHRNIVSQAPLEAILTESDSPYEYRGMRMTPFLVVETVKEIAAIKGLDEEYVKNIIWNNFRRKILQKMGK